MKTQHASFSFASQLFGQPLGLNPRSHDGEINLHNPLTMPFAHYYISKLEFMETLLLNPRFQKILLLKTIIC